MANVKLEINKRIDVIWNDRIYKSSVQDITKDYIAIAAPITGGIYLPLHKGDTFTSYYFIDDKQLYEFSSVVIGRRIEDKVQLVILDYPKEIKMVQRREFVRVELYHSIKYVVSTVLSDLENVDVAFNSGHYKNGIILDMSGGGIRFKTDTKLEKGNLVTIDLDLFGRNIRINGKIVRSSKEDNGSFVSGIEFFNITEKTRDKIIQLIFEIMRKQLKSS